MGVCPQRQRDLVRVVVAQIACGDRRGDAIRQQRERRGPPRREVVRETPGVRAPVDEHNGKDVRLVEGELAIDDEDVDALLDKRTAFWQAFESRDQTVEAVLADRFEDGVTVAESGDRWRGPSAEPRRDPPHRESGRPATVVVDRLGGGEDTGSCLRHPSLTALS